MGKESVNFSGWQLTSLVLLRLLIGWHFLYEGLFKLINPDWSSLGYLLDSQWIFKGFFHSLAANPSVLAVVDFLNMWGLILIGLGLILGLFTRLSCIAGIILLAFYYFSHPPFPGLNYTMPMEGNYLIINKTLIEIFTIWVLFKFPTGRRAGIDRILFGRK
jgi:thiosulfate dehydrogenase [quinone] large subunit